MPHENTKKIFSTDSVSSLDIIQKSLKPSHCFVCPIDFAALMGVGLHKEA
jgi:hypothetical protein